MSIQKCLSFHEFYKLMLGKGSKNEIAELTEHIQSCSKCKLELSFIESMYESLQSSPEKKEQPVLFEKHISAATREAYFQNTLPDSVKNSVHRHLAACRDCFAEFHLILGNDPVQHITENDSAIQKIKATEIPDRLTAYKRQFIINDGSKPRVLEKLAALLKNKEGLPSWPRIAVTGAMIFLLATLGYQQISFQILRRTVDVVFDSVLHENKINPDGLRPIESEASLVGRPKGDKTLSSQIQRAQIEIEKALEHRPNDARLNHQLGTVYFFAGNMMKAEEFYQKALSLDQKNAGIHNDLALININNKDFDEAINQLTIALSLDPHLLEAQYNLAIVFELKQETSKAIQAWEKYLELDKEPGSDWKKLAQRRLQKLQP